MIAYKVLRRHQGHLVSLYCLPTGWRRRYAVGKWTEGRYGSRLYCLDDEGAARQLHAGASLFVADDDGIELWRVEAEDVQPMRWCVCQPSAQPPEALAAFWRMVRDGQDVRRQYRPATPCVEETLPGTVMARRVMPLERIL